MSVKKMEAEKLETFVLVKSWKNTFFCLIQALKFL